MEPIAKSTDLSTRLAGIEAQLAHLVERQRRTEELFAEMTPVLREVMSHATTKLDELEKKGYFAFGRELVAVGDRVATGFTPEDVRQLGDAIVGILQTVRALTQPKVLEIAADASEALEESDKAEPIGLFGAMRATHDDDVQKGMAVMMEVMRHVGRAAAAVREQRKADPNEVRKAKLAAALGPRRKNAVVAASTPSPKTNGKPAAPAILEGVAVGADGHVVDPSAWTPELAGKIAAREGVELDGARWAVVQFARADFEKTGVSPNIRRITQGTSLATKDVYTLFPKAPGRTIAKIAGIPKPAGCI